MKRKICCPSKKLAASQCHCMMNWASSLYTRWCSPTPTSCATSLISFRKEECQIAPTSSTCLTLSIPFMCRRWLRTRIISETLRSVRREQSKRLIFLTAGGRNSPLSPSSHVSSCEKRLSLSVMLSDLLFFTLCIDHKGRTIHLLKSKSKPVP